MTKAKRKSVTTKNTTKKKKVITPVIELVDISEQDKRRIHGEKFEEEMDMLLIKAGVPGNKVTINSPELGSVISDHCYENYWIESTTWFDKKRVDEFNKKKNIIIANTSKFTKFVIFCENVLSKKYQTIAQTLKDNDWIVIDGSENITAFIDMLSTRNTLNVDGVIRVAVPKLIDRKLLLHNPFNRNEKAKGILNIAKSIVNYGFITGLFVVPKLNDKGETIGYMLFEGHHRLSAINLVNEWGFSLDKIPCIVVDWLNADELKRVNTLLIKINVEYKKWELIDYIKNYADLYKELKLPNLEYGYRKLLELRDIAKPNGFTENFLIYIFGKTSGPTLFLDKDNITDGEFRMSKDEYENFVIPFMNVLKKPYTTAYSNKKYVANVYQYLCKRLFAEFKKGKLSLADVRMWLGGYNYLGTNDIPTKTGELKEIWNTKLLNKVNEVKEMFAE